MTLPGRNAEPVTFLDAVPDDGHATIVQLADGREFLDANVAMPEKDIDRIRTGWVCISCYEPQSEAFPEICESVLPDGVTRWCNFPIREKQPEEFAIKFKGTVHIGSKINPADELERLNQFSDFEERTGLIIPPSVRNSD